MDQAVVQIVLRARNEMQQGINAALGDLTSLEKKAKELGQRMNAVALPMMALGGSMAAGIGAAAKVASDYQSALTELVTGAGEAKSAIAGVSQGLLDMAGKVGVGPLELAKAMYPVESAGFHGAAGLKVLETAAIAAKVGAADMATVADAVTTSLNAYGLGADQAGRVTDILIASVSAGKMHFQDLAGSLGTILPTSAAARVSLAETAAAISTMSAQGTAPQEGVTHLRMALASLQKAAPEAKKAFESIGLSSASVAQTLTSRGLLAALEQIQTALDARLPRGSAAANAALMTMFGGVESGKSALELMNGHLDTFRAKLADIAAAATGTGATLEGWGEVQQDARLQTERLHAVTQSMSIAIGNAFLPALQRITGAIAPVIKSITTWAQAHPELVAKIALVTAGSLLLVGGLLLVGSTILNLIPIIGALVSPVGLVIGAVGLLYVAFANNWGGIRDIAQKGVSWVGEALDKVFALVNKARTALGLAPYGWREEWQKLVSGINAAGNAVGGTFNKLKGGILGGLGTKSLGLEDIKAMLANQTNLPREAAAGLLPSTGGGIGDVLQDTGTKFSDLATAVQGVIGDIANMGQSAIDASKALGLMSGVDTLKPGENGPFEALFRIQDIAQNYKTPGKDTKKWEQMYGLDQAAAQNIVRQFQQGMLMSPDVLKYIDVGKFRGALGQQAAGEKSLKDFAALVGADPKLIQQMLGAKGMQVTGAQAETLASAVATGKLDAIVKGSLDNITATNAVGAAVTTGANSIVTAIQTAANKPGVQAFPTIANVIAPHAAGPVGAQLAKANEMPPVAKDLHPLSQIAAAQYTPMGPMVTGPYTPLTAPAPEVLRAPTGWEKMLGALSGVYPLLTAVNQGQPNAQIANTSANAPAAPVISVTVSDGAVKITGDADGHEGIGNRVADAISRALQAMAQAEKRQTTTAPAGLPGNAI